MITNKGILSPQIIDKVYLSKNLSSAHGIRVRERIPGRSKMRRWSRVLIHNIVFLVIISLSTSTSIFAMQDIARDKNCILQGGKQKPVYCNEYDTGEYLSPDKQMKTRQLKKEGFAQKTQKLYLPFMVNAGQVDERVKFYANTFMGTVFITDNGEIVYSLRNPKKGETIPLKDRNRRLSLNPERFRTQDILCRQNKHQNITHHKYGALYQNCVSNFITMLKTGAHDSIWAKESVPENDISSLICKHEAVRSTVMKEEFIREKVPEVRGEGKAITKVSYFKGKDPSRWKADVSTYHGVDFGEIYPGVKVKVKAQGNNIEKLFYVKAGADPEAIKIKLSEVNNIRVNEDGQLEVDTKLGTVKFSKPLAYQEIDGKRVNVDVEYQIQKTDIRSQGGETNPSKTKSGIRSKNSTGLPFDTRNQEHRYGFKVSSHNKRYPLVIDPLLSSTYLGGNGDDFASSIILDSHGNVYVTGWTSSSDFPITTGAYDTSFNGANDVYRGDVFITKLSSDLTSLLSSTYLGGFSGDTASSIFLDSSGNVYVTGYTESIDFPTTTGAYDTSFNGLSDIFISKLSGDLNELLASTYLGGSFGDAASSIFPDSSGNIYVTGNTGSSDFPTTPGAYDTSFNGGDDSFSDVFIAELSSDLTSLLASTYLGGSSSDFTSSVVLDAHDNVYVSGQTFSPDFPITTGVYDTSPNGDNDVFISKLSGDLTSLLASTYMGGHSDDSASSIVLDSSVNVYVTGCTGSSDFPTTPGAYNTSYNAGSYFSCDVFISKLSNDLSNLMASTYVGGSSSDSANSIVMDPSSNIYVTGDTSSTDFPMTLRAYDTSYNLSDYNVSEIFISKLDGDLTNLLASTYLGGSSDNTVPPLDDFASSIVLDSSGNVYVTGYTGSPDFPTTVGAYDTFFNAGLYFGTDVFLSMLDSNLSGSPTPTQTPSPTTSSLPTPIPCEAANLNAEPEQMKLKREESGAETVMATCETGEPVAGVTITAEVRKGKKHVTVLPSSAVTDVIL